MKWLLLKFFDFLYHSFAWSYDLVAWIVSGGRWKEWVISIRTFIHGEVVLELGSGTGILQAALISAGYRTMAVDESQQMLRIVNKRIRKEMPEFQAGIMRGRAESLPLSENSADTVVATFPSDYIGRPETIKECRRVLKTGGRLVVLLGVEIEGNGNYDRFLRFLYAFTLQKTPPLSILNKALDKMKSYGFEAHIETIMSGQDRLTLIIAE